MKPSTDLLVRIYRIFSAIGSQDQPLDDLSRSIFLQVAEASANKQNIKVSDVVHSGIGATAPTVYGRLKQLIDMDLIRSSTDPEDGRAVLLALTPKAQKKMKKMAQELREACKA